VNPPSIAVIGPGSVGIAVARAYSDAGGVVRVVVSRDAGRAERWATACRAAGAATDVAAAVTSGADVVLIAVPDRAVAAVGHALSAAPECSAVVLHTSGALAGAALGSRLSDTGSLHPLQTLTAPPGDTDDHRAAGLAEAVRGAHWFHEGAGAEVARPIVATLGGYFHPLQAGAKALYHAGAAVLSNHTVALYAMALDLFDAAGVARDDAAGALDALLAGTASNLAGTGVPHALTGPVARGDIETVDAHLAALTASTPELRDAYAAMALRAVEIAVAKGSLDEAGAMALRQRLSR
jgi:predicted short-subunit dehydrogenase-like oxidoreductase (DUF2520 family)